MQISHVRIQNFRQFEDLKLDFTDPLGRVRDLTLLIGPNGSGKTTVLDAIAAAIGPTTELPSTRTSLKLSPPSIVRKGALCAKVTCRLRFTEDEIAATRALFEYSGDDKEVPDAREAELTWTYPDPQRRIRRGYAAWNPWGAWTLLKGRVYLARLLGLSSHVDLEWFRRVGRVITVDQQRTALAKVIRQDIARIIQGDVGESEEEDSRWTSDPRTILLDLAVKSSIPGPTDDEFQRIKERYAEICAPRRILGPVRDEMGALDVRFSDGSHEYGYDGVSSGEAMVLLFLIKMVSERIHRSIVLVDEVELHQHPVWQRRLLHLLTRVGDENQIIATSHSSYLRDVVPRDAVREVVPRSGTINLGALGDSETSEDADSSDG